MANDGEVRIPAPVKAVLVADIDQDSQRGQFEYYIHASTGATPRGMIYCCPCGCGRLGALPFHPLLEDDVKNGRHGWTWDGNREAPTLAPSINNVGHWHGFLTNGMFTQA